MEKKDPEISVILPIYNEEGNIEKMVEEIVAALEPLQRSFEILCVDDASQDKSVEKMKEVQAREKRIVIRRHKRNFGQSAAQATGFRHAQGSILVTLDADGQNNPADIPNLLALLGEYDCVCGIRRKRQDSWAKKKASKIGNGVRNWLTGDKIQDSGCTLRAFYKESLREIPIFNGMHRFLPTLLRTKGKRVTETLVDHRPRTWGKSKYGIKDRAWRGLLDCLAIRWWTKRSFPQEREN